MGKKSKRRGDKSPRSVKPQCEETNGLTANVDTAVGAALGFNANQAAVFSSMMNHMPKAFTCRGRLPTVVKKLKAAQRNNAFDSYSCTFDRIFVKIACIAKGVLKLPGGSFGMNNDDCSADERNLGFYKHLKSESKKFLACPAFDEMVPRHTDYLALIMWCKLAEAAKSLASGRFGELFEPLFDDTASHLLNKISSNEDECMPLRAMAMVARATIMHRHGTSTNEASCRRRANLFLSKASASDYPSFATGHAGRRVLGASAFNQMTQDSCGSGYADLVSTCVGESNLYLTKIEGPSHSIALAAADAIKDPANPSPEVMAVVASLWKYCMSVGGAFCDYCHKSREDFLSVNFLKCGDCRLAHYCSEDCQRMAWGRGHKKHCKKFGCFAVGDDVVTARGIGPTYHAKVVEIIKGGSTLKCDLGTEGFAVVSKRDLRHIRPLL